MWLNFFGADQSYHLARRLFVYKGLLPARERGLLDGASQCARDERRGTDRRVAFTTGQVNGLYAGGQPTRDDSVGSKNMTAEILD